MTRQNILITGASSRLGGGMARQFAAQGRHLALSARRTDRLAELKPELSQRYPRINIAFAALDVNDHEQVPQVFAELNTTLGGIDRVIVNVGVGKGAPLGSGQLPTNTAIIETNLVAALVQTETALEMFKAAGSGHLVLMSSVVSARGDTGCLGCLCCQQSRTALAWRITTRGIRRRPDQDFGHRGGRYRVGDET